jgi:TatD DNase family protein
VAIGECGLDYSYLKDLPLEKQEEFKKLEEKEFRKQIRIAKEYNLPLILHLRNLYKKALEILQEETFNGQLVFHFFTGSLEDLELILQNPNCFIGFSGVITYGNKLDEVIRGVPLERILIETDAPYVAPIPYRGQRNESAYVVEVAQKIAEIKNLPLKEVEKTTFENTKKLFRIE